MPQTPSLPLVTAFKDSPDRGRGLARDLRVRWAFASAAGRLQRVAKDQGLITRPPSYFLLVTLIVASIFSRVCSRPELASYSGDMTTSPLRGPSVYV